MNTEQNPFSLFDFLGYFFPGAGLILSLNLILNGKISEYLEFIKGTDIDIFISLILISYIAGHILSFCSSLTIEKYGIWRYGYPSYFLLHKRNKIKYFKKRDKCVYSMENLKRAVIGGTFLLPISIIDLSSRFLLNNELFYVRPINDKRVRNHIKRKFCFAIKEINGQKNIDTDTKDSYILIQHYTLEYSTVHVKKLHKYVAIYGFNRAFSFIFIVLFWILLFYYFLAEETTVNTNILLYASLTCMLTGYIFFIAYMKFFRRCTLEAFMFLAITKHRPQ